MTKHILTFITILFFSCSTQKDNKDEIYYIIKHHEQTVVDTGTIPPPMPPLMFYGRHNFILFDTNRVFYHKNYLYHSCGNGIELSKPPRLFLSTENLNEIKIDELNLFLQNNLRGSIINDNWLTANISSGKDTIKNKAFRIITDFFKVNNFHRYGIRHWTEEEAFAVTAKVNKKSYDPKTADFSIGFDIKFIPPTDTTLEK